jgi:hypothetical protein
MDQKLPAKPDSDLSTQAVSEMAKYGIILGPRTCRLLGSVEIHLE